MLFLAERYNFKAKKFVNLLLIGMPLSKCNFGTSTPIISTNDTQDPVLDNRRESYMFLK